MPSPDAHILILGKWKALAAQHDTLTHQIQENIDNNEYEGEQLTQAQAFISDTTTLWTSIDTEHAEAADRLSSNMEEFLGI